jgi:hypothetical protein
MLGMWTGSFLPQIVFIFILREVTMCNNYITSIQNNPTFDSAIVTKLNAGYYIDCLYSGKKSVQKGKKAKIGT